MGNLDKIKQCYKPESVTIKSIENTGKKSLLVAILDSVTKSPENELEFITEMYNSNCKLSISKKFNKKSKKNKK